MNLALTWLVFILAFGGMVIIHEFGHFIVARICNIEVEEFGIGLPTPGAITMFTWKGTRFTLNWLPLGGFVRPKGENDPNVEGGLAAASPWKRLAVLFAGPLMNLISAVIIFNIIFLRAGVPDNKRILVSTVTPDSPAALAGFQVGDIFISGNSKPINNYDELRVIVDANENKPITFLMNRRNDQVEIIATPQMNQETNRTMIGVGLGTPFVPVSSWTQAVPLGFEATWSSIKNLVTLPIQIIEGNLTPEESRIVGPVGIFRIFEQTVSQDIQASQTETSASPDPLDKPINTLGVIASISISLGIFNLLPIPALDGGRILFVLPELLFRRRIPPERENFVNGVAMMLLIMFMFYIIVMDVIHPIPITLP